MSRIRDVGIVPSDSASVKKKGEWVKVDEGNAEERNWKKQKRKSLKMEARTKLPTNHQPPPSHPRAISLPQRAADLPEAPSRGIPFKHRPTVLCDVDGGTVDWPNVDSDIPGLF